MQEFCEVPADNSIDKSEDDCEPLLNVGWNAPPWLPCVLCCAVPSRSDNPKLSAVRQIRGEGLYPVRPPSNSIPLSLASTQLVPPPLSKKPFDSKTFKQYNV